MRYPCVNPVGFPNHLLSPSLPAPSLSGPVTSGEVRLQVHFAQWGRVGRGGHISLYARALVGVTANQHLVMLSLAVKPLAAGCFYRLDLIGHRHARVSGVP